MSQPRFPRLTPEEMSPEQREVAAEISAGPRGEVRGPFIALLHNPALFDVYLRVARDYKLPVAHWRDIASRPDHAPLNKDDDNEN